MTSFRFSRSFAACALAWVLIREKWEDRSDPTALAAACSSANEFFAIGLKEGCGKNGMATLPLAAVTLAPSALFFAEDLVRNSLMADDMSAFLMPISSRMC